ncbi:putative protein arginine N-methyltransferase 6.1 [Pseudolycoriella hygida]|uniref:type I protein arginine methyltransferase n=1 Tax=Pseudolycoriella hygida TaxID=35572 RepID=A0A9Q0NDG8_9DIPT|nr:putative protein arginine N-methyltransferase 6.1 [Pseudolycoriella hygida]
MSVLFSEYFSKTMTEKRQKLHHNFFQIINFLDQLDQLGDSDNDNDDAVEKCTRRLFRGETTPTGLDELKEQTDQRCYVWNPTKGLMDGQNPLEILSNEQFVKIYRFSKECVEDILQMISYGLTKFTNRGKPFSPMVQLLITLQFLATGSFKTKKNFIVSQPTISRIIKKVSSLLSELRLRFIKIPEKTDFKNISSEFLAEGNFPEVFGCIGSTHIPIKSPGKSICDGYYNENGFYSFRVFMVCGPDLSFYELISRWPGATQENKIFNISEIHQKFQFNQLEGVLLADNNYPMSNFVMTPVEQPRNVEDCMYNDCHKNTYNIDKVVKLWKQRFKCLQGVLNNKEDTTQMIIQATAVLHNIAIQRKQPLTSESNAKTLKNPCNQSKDNLKQNSSTSCFVGQCDPQAPMVHEIMLRDKPRLIAYRDAIKMNELHFKGKTVLDVGCGTGILSVLSAKAGAKKVYAVEASNIAEIARQTVKENNYENVIEVFQQRVEDFTLPNGADKVDILISEWMGFYLLHEGMLDSVIYARDNFLKPDGLMFPQNATINVAPCAVPTKFDWNDVEGVKMTCFGEAIRTQGPPKPEILLIGEKDLRHDGTVMAWLDLKEVSADDIDEINFKEVIVTSFPGEYQGVCIWFECEFPADEFGASIVLTTSPFAQPTHWKQTVIVLPDNARGQCYLSEKEPVAFSLKLQRNPLNQRQYNIEMTLIDVEEIEHQLPCDCIMTKCILAKAHLKKIESLDAEMKDI